LALRQVDYDYVISFKNLSDVFLMHSIRSGSSRCVVFLYGILVLMPILVVESYGNSGLTYFQNWKWLLQAD